MIRVSKFGSVAGQDAHQIELTSSTGVIVKLISFGASVRDWIVPMGLTTRSVVLGFDRIEHYIRQRSFFGAIVGRVANRIQNAEFDLDGQLYHLEHNDGDHQLHGGSQGIHSQVWDFELDEGANSVCFSLKSVDGAMGFPGHIDFRVTYTLMGHKLRLDFSGSPDRPTPIALAQHIYFNLGAKGDVLDHSVFIDADRYTPTDLDLIASGEILSVSGSKFDFQSTKTFQDKEGGAVDFDVNLLFRRNREIQKPVAIVSNPSEDLTLKLTSDRPGLQLFNSATIKDPFLGNGGKVYGAYSGFCLEDQMVPGALHQKNFPSIICTPDVAYRHWCEIDIS